MGYWDDIKTELFYEDFDFIRGNYSGVERLDELLDLVLSFKEGHEDFIRFGKMDGFKGSKIFHHKKNLKPFKVMVRKGLGNDYRLPLYIPKITRRVITGNAFVGVDSLVHWSFISFSGRELTREDDKMIQLSDIMQYLTYCLDDFDKADEELPDFDIDFFKRMHHLYWEDKKAEKLEDKISDMMANIYGIFDLNFSTLRTLRFAVLYFMGCNALYNNRDYISCEDVVVSYLVCFKIVLTDIRPLVRSLYDAEKWDSLESSIFTWLQ